MFGVRARLVLGEGDKLLDAAATAARVRVSGAVGALADTVERRGATVYERTPVTRVLPRTATSGPRLVTAAGDVVAEAVVVAGEAWLSKLRGWRRMVLPLYSLIVLTEPVDDDRWAEIGWAVRECLASQRLSVDHLARTGDGRILFGGRGAPYRFGSRLDAGHGPSRTDARAAPAGGGRVVPAPHRRGLHPCLGRARRHAPGLGADVDRQLGELGRRPRVRG
ncbi:MAG: FAD-dependent oxidoreductase [Actinomycetota bacterium]|nr:FAD-dependent oxidoreductase [Actinomycetota bacterium]